MQSCSMSSLGRWSMEVLTGKRERGFFFFSKSGAEHGHANSKTRDHTKSEVGFSQRSARYRVCLCSSPQPTLLSVTPQKLESKSTSEFLNL